MRQGGVRRRGILVALAVVALTSGCASPLPTASPFPRVHHTKTHAVRSLPTVNPSRSPKPKPSPSRSKPKPSPTRRGPRPKGRVSRGWRVYDVVDGDTVKVVNGGRELTIRLIGIDTPETVDPFRPVGCFGPEASAFAQRTLAGRHVWLEFDRSQGRLDKYDRTLAYVWVAPRDGGPWMYDQRVVRRGYGFEYTYDTPYLWQREFLRAEYLARTQRLGLWSPKTCDGKV